VAVAIVAYYQHRSFRHELAPATQKMRRAILERFREQHGDKRVAKLQRVHIAAILSSKTPERRTELDESLARPNAVLR
jgi:hypothetical protein